MNSIMKYMIKTLVIVLGIAAQTCRASESAQIGQKITDFYPHVEEIKTFSPNDNLDYQQQVKSRQKVEQLLGVKIVAGIIQEQQKDPSFFEKAKNYATPMLISALITSAVTLVNKYMLTSAEERAVMLAAQKQQIEINKLALEQQRQELEARKVIIEEARIKQVEEKKAILEELIAKAKKEDQQQLQEKLQKFCKKQALELMSNKQTDLLLQVKPV